MPSAQVIDLNPLPRTEMTTLEKTLSSFSKRSRESQLESQETDALRDIYKTYQQEGKDIEEAFIGIQTRPGISPTTRVNSIKQLLEFKEYNEKLQEKARKESEKAEEKAANQAILADIEKRRGLDPGSLKAYEDDPKMAESITRPAQGTQASRPIDEDQLKRINHITAREDFKNADPYEQNLMLMNGGVSKENAEAILKPRIEQEKSDVAAEKLDKQYEYKVHKDSAKLDEQIVKEAKAARNQLDAISDVKKSIKNVSPYSVANIFKNFGEVGKAISNAVLSKDQAKIQASIPAFLEGRKELFGVRLSDADLSLLSDKLPDIGKSQEANEQILKLMTRYSKLSLLREKISNNIKKANKGFRPIDYTEQLEEKFDEMKKIVKIINPVNNRVIDIPAFELEDAILSGATLYNE